MKINGILLAAGKSSRFVSNKLLTDFNGKPLICHILEKTKNVHFDDIVVVTQYKEVQKIAELNRIRSVINHNPEKGLSHSIQLGIKESKATDAYMFFVCDQPLLSLDTIKNMIEIYHFGNKSIVCAGDHDHVGNPVIFSSVYKKELLSLEGDVGARHLIQKHLGEATIYQVDNENELFDIDTLDDFRLAKDHKISNI